VAGKLHTVKIFQVKDSAPRLLVAVSFDGVVQRLRLDVKEGESPSKTLKDHGVVGPIVTPVG
jgi:hypothetical protein